MTREISLTQGKVALVDDDDFDALVQQKWCANRFGSHWYAQRSEHKQTVLMHRQVMEPPAGMDVDHVNGDGLDNRRANLRVCTRSQNLANQSAKPENTSGFKGVSWDKRTRKWIAFISVRNRNINLGRFDDPEAAHAAYIEAARKHFGEFARTE